MQNRLLSSSLMWLDSYHYCIAQISVKHGDAYAECEAECSSMKRRQGVQRRLALALCIRRKAAHASEPVHSVGSASLAQRQRTSVDQSWIPAVHLVQVEEVESQSKQMILVNPILKDLPSHSGIMGVKGREDRLKLASSFETVYHFRLLYRSGTFYPIQGALRQAFGSPWQVRVWPLPGKAMLCLWPRLHIAHKHMVQHMQSEPGNCRQMSFAARFNSCADRPEV
jgi:Domain of unknown function (DUF1995)